MKVTLSQLVAFAASSSLLVSAIPIPINMQMAATTLDAAPMPRSAEPSPEALEGVNSNPDDANITITARATVAKRCISWDYTNTQQRPTKINELNFNAPVKSVHNWNAWYPQELAGRLPFRPMVRTRAQLGGDEWKWIQASKEQIVHFFNEPERQGISVADALASWRSQMLSLRKAGKKLVSPSCASDPPGQQWLASFMSGLGPNEKPDFLGLHWYGKDSAEGIKFMQNHHATHNLPIIVSEIASIDNSYPSVLRFTARMANWMDTTDYIYEYAFFGLLQNVDAYTGDASRLMTAQGGFTDLFHKLMYDVPMKEQ